MKLRIHQNSLRLRLTQSEVTRLAAGEALIQSTPFSPTTSLTTTLQPADIPTPRATLTDTKITIQIPTPQLHNWATSTQVAIESTQKIDEKTTLTVLIEKDFQCLHRPHDTPDAYPNPN